MTMLREQLGAAVNATDLRSVAEHECHIDRVAAMGQAQRIEFNGQLGAALVRLRYGADRTALKPAVYLLALAIRRCKDRRRWRLGKGAKAADAVIAKLAVAVLEEWLHDKCPACAGRGWTGLHPDAVRTRHVCCQACNGTGAVEVWSRRGVELLLHGDHDGQIVAPLRKVCSTCNGKGTVAIRLLRKPSAGRVCAACLGTGDRRNGPRADVFRARALGVDVATYRERWARWYEDVLIQLQALESRFVDFTRLQLGRDRATVAPA